MKKLFLILIPFLFLSCNTGYFTGLYEYEFVNNSSINISLQIEDDSDIHIIQSRESYNIKMDHNNSYSFLNNPRITTKKECKKPHSYYYIYINDMDYHKVILFNSSSYDIIVTEKDGLLGDNYNDSLLLSAGQTVETKVYTLTPSFIVLYKDNLMPAEQALSIKAN